MEKCNKKFIWRPKNEQGSPQNSTGTEYDPERPFNAPTPKRAGLEQNNRARSNGRDTASWCALYCRNLVERELDSLTAQQMIALLGRL